MSIASYYHQRDVLSRNPVVGYHVFRYGSDNWTNAFSSSNSVVFIHFSVRLGTPSFHHQYLSLTYLAGDVDVGRFRAAKGLGRWWMAFGRRRKNVEDNWQRREPT